MSCRRAFDIDLTAFVADASGPEWADFRAHYPGCAECAAEVRIWTELHETLRAGAATPSSHPAEALLVEYAERADTLAADDLRSIEHHVAACRLCADELTTLRKFDFAALGPAAAAQVRPAAWQRGASAARGGGLAGATRRIGRVLVHPAFAYAVVLLLLVPVLVRERGAQPARPGAMSKRMRDDERKDIPADYPERDKAASAPRERLAAAPPAAAGASDVPANRLASNARPADLSLLAGTPAEIRASDIDRSLRLRVSLGGDAWWHGRLQMRMVGPDPGRELRQQIDGPTAVRSDADAAPQLDVNVPAEWLVPGSYVVEVSPVTALTVAEKAQDATGGTETHGLHRERAEQARVAVPAPLRFTFTVR